MPETDAQKVVRLSEAAADKALVERRGFTITKFSRHEDGYFHAHVTPAGQKRIYVHKQYGSWLAPGKINGRELLKEIESFGLPFEAKVELQRKARAFERAEKEQETEMVTLTPLQAARITSAVFGPEETQKALVKVYGMDPEEAKLLMQQLNASQN